jgi:hypothetical protein
LNKERQMPNYRETTASGTSYTRAHTAIINNGHDHKSIEFQEERVVVMDDGETIGKRIGHISADFTAETAATVFPILDPITGLDTGATATYGEVYGLLFSVYMHMAAERDTYIAEQQAEADALALAIAQEQGVAGGDA